MSKRSETTKTAKPARGATRTGTRVAATRARGDQDRDAERAAPTSSDLPQVVKVADGTFAAPPEAFIEAVPDAIAVYDLEGCVVRSNKAYRDSLARFIPKDRPTTLRERAKESPLRDMQGEPLGEEQWPHTRMLRGEAIVGNDAVEVLMYTPDGDAVYMSVTGAPLHADNGQIMGAVAIHHDITAQKQLERELRQSRDELQAILEAVPDQVIVYDTNLHLLRSNATHRAAVARFHAAGQAPDELPQRIQQTGTVFRNLSGAQLSEGDWPQQRILRGETLSGPSAVEAQAYTVTGDPQWWTVSGAPLRSEDGTIIGSVLVNTDITRRKELEQERASLLQRERLARAEAEVTAAQLRAVLEAMPNGVSIVDVTGKAILFNDAVRQIWGSPLFVSERLEDYGEYRAWWPETGKRVAAEEWGMSRALRFGETVSDEEVDIETFDGQRKTILNSSAPVRDAAGAPIGGVTVSVDITQRKRLERAAIEWAAQLDATFESLTDGAFLYDSSGQLLRMNDAARVIFALDAAPGYAALASEERIARLQVRDAHDRPLAPEQWGLRGLARGERLSEPVELRITALDGSAKDLAITGGPVRASDGMIIGSVSLLRDVTQRRLIERAAAEQSAELQATFDALAEPMCVFDAQGRILRQNKAEIAILGFDQPPATVEERAARINLRDPQGQRLPPEQLPSRRVLAGATLVGIDAIELVARAADGNDHRYLVGGAPIRDEAGNVTGGVIFYRDVTERRLLGQQVRWQASLLERSHDAIFMWELGGPILYWNHGAELLYGYAKEQAVGQISHKLLKTELPVSLAVFTRDLKRDGEWIGDIRHTTRDGRRLVVESRHQLLVEADGHEYVLETCRDITERLELEEALRRSRDELEQRVRERTRDLAIANRSLRRLSSQVLEVQETERRRIARELHDEIGQALTGVKMMFETAQRKAAAHGSNGSIGSNGSNGSNSVERGSPVPDMRDAIDAALSRVRELSLDLRPAMLDSLGLLPTLLWRFENYTRQTGIEVEFHHIGLDQRFAPEVETGAYRITQEALTNVARHAATPAVRVQMTATDAALRIYIIDEGAGFDADNAIASGLSTGLAGMRERATLLGGAFLVSSAPGAGTTIEVELPLAVSNEDNTSESDMLSD